VRGVKTSPDWRVGLYLFVLANPEFYSHLASWRVVIRTPALMVIGTYDRSQKKFFPLPKLLFPFPNHLHPAFLNNNNNNTGCYIRAFPKELKARRSIPA
jgi:hypothetical protein